MDLVSQNLLLTSGGGKKDSTYVDDVFSTYLYKGNGANRTITNGIDLAGEGGLVWAKGRTIGYYNILQDNVSNKRLTGTTNYLTSNENHIANASSNQITAFNNNGFDLGIMELQSILTLMILHHGRFVDKKDFLI